MSEFLKSLLEAFLSDAAARVAGIEQALERDDRHSVEALAHGLKSQQLALGRREVRGSLRQLEAIAHWADSGEALALYGQIRAEFSELEQKVVDTLEQCRTTS
jgi:HPt (histidine-containing phosphotransfer) domain-containing protein